MVCWSFIDQGIPVYFAGDDLDVTSGAAAWQPISKPSSSRITFGNLKEEAKRGIQARLKQGLLPNHEPLGYLDTGPGKVKAMDPERRPSCGWPLPGTPLFLAPSALRSWVQKPGRRTGLDKRALTTLPQPVLLGLYPAEINSDPLPGTPRGSRRPGAFLCRAVAVAGAGLAETFAAPVQVQPDSAENEAKAETKSGFVSTQASCLTLLVRPITSSVS